MGVRIFTVDLDDVDVEEGWPIRCPHCRQINVFDEAPDNGRWSRWRCVFCKETFEARMHYILKSREQEGKA